MFTLIIPALMAGDEMPLPPLNTPALNQLRRFARFQAHNLTTAQLYHRFLCDRLALDECSAYASPVVQQMGMNSVQMLDLKAACTNLPPETAQQYADRLNQEYAGEYCAPMCGKSPPSGRWTGPTSASGRPAGGSIR